MKFQRSLLAMLALVAMNSAVEASEPIPGSNYIGINPWFLNDWDGSNAFADIAVHGRRWQAATDWHDSVAIDAEGWPTADASTVFFGTGTQTGRYHLQFEGQAQKVSVMWLGGSVDSLTWDPSSNLSRAVVTLTGAMGGSGGLALTGTKRTSGSALGSGFRNLHLWRPGYPADGSRLFTNEWEGLMRRFQVVRFMDWGSTNANPLVSWPDRRKPSDAHHGDVTLDGRTGDLGMPIEFMVALCNRTGTDAWINVPPMADSGYVANLVKTVLHGSDGRSPYSAATPNPVWAPLGSNLKLYLEYGNELWNFAGGFNGFHWLHEQSLALQAGPRTEPIFYDAQTDEWVSLFRWMGWRAAQMSIWARSAAGDAAMMDRVRPVLEGQIGYHAMTGNILPFLETWFATTHAGQARTYRVKDLFWGNGGASYSTSKGLTPATFLAAGNYPEDYLSGAISADAILARAYGLHNVAYEGGPALDLLAATSKDSVFSDPRMQDLMIQHHQRWTALGGELAVYYCANGADNWRFSRNPTDTLSPKLLAIAALRSAPATPPSLGCVAPCRMRADTLHNGFSEGGFWTSKGAMYGFDPGEWQAYPVSIPTAGLWDLTLQAQADEAGDTLAVLLSDSLVALRAVPDTKAFSDLLPVRLSLAAGLQVVRIRGQHGRTALSNLSWSSVGGQIGVLDKLSASRSLRLGRNGGGFSWLQIPANARRLEILRLDGTTIEAQEIGESTGSIVLDLTQRGTYLVRVRTSSGSTVSRSVLL